LLSGLEALHGAHPGMFGPPRGIGLMLGLPVLEPYQAKAIVERARVDEHMLLNAAGDNTLRFVPALVLSEAQAREALGRLTRVVARLESSEELSA